MNLSIPSQEIAKKRPLGSALACRAALLAPIALLALITGLNFRLIGDEARYHLRVIRQFADAWPHLSLANYPSASGPLPYLVWVAVGKVVGFDIWKLRLVSVFISLLSVQVFYSLCLRARCRSPFLLSLGFTLLPYIFFHACTVYTVSFSLLFGLLALLCFMPSRHPRPGIVVGSLWTTLAVWCRQFSLDLAGGMLLYTFTAGLRRFPSDRREWCVFLKRALVLLFPVAALLPLLFLWRGFTPPAHQTDRVVGVTIQNLVYIPMLTTFYCFPALLMTRPRRIREKWARYALALAVLLLGYVAIQTLMPLRFDDTVDARFVMTGIMARFIDLITFKGGNLTGMILQFGLWLPGVAILWQTMTNREKTEADRLLLCMVIAFTVLISLTPFLSERYYAPLLSYLILVSMRDCRNKPLLGIWIGWLSILSGLFTYWQIAVKTFW